MPIPKLTNPSHLKRLRRQLDLSVEQLAATMGVASGRTLRRWEIGSHDIPAHIDIFMDLLNQESAFKNFMRARGMDADYVSNAVTGFLVDRGLVEWNRRMDERDIEAENGGFAEAAQ